MHSQPPVTARISSMASARAVLTKSTFGSSEAALIQGFKMPHKYKFDGTPLSPLKIHNLLTSCVNLRTRQKKRSGNRGRFPEGVKYRDILPSETQNLKLRERQDICLDLKTSREHGKNCNNL